MQMPERARTPRGRVVAAGCGVVAAGLAVALLGRGPVADLLGDALYAVLVYLVVVFVAPRARLWVQASAALAVCVAVECAQLTPWPAAAVDAWGPARFVLGTTFAPADLGAYAAGITVCAILASRRAARRQPDGAPRPVTGEERAVRP